MNHKAQFDFTRKTIYWMFAGVIITGVMLTFAFTLATYKEKLLAVPPELKAELVGLRFMYNSDCFAYQHKETKVTHPGVIDLKKFTSAQMNNCYPILKEKGTKTFNFRLKLEQEGSEIKSNSYYNKDDFAIFKEVLVKKGDEITKDRLIIYVQEKI